MPRGGHHGGHHGSHVSHLSHHHSTFSSHHRHHGSYGSSAVVFRPRVLTPAAAAHAEASLLYARYYTPAPGCCPNALPYLGGLLQLAAFATTLASILLPWYYFGGAEPVLDRSNYGKSWGVAVSLTALTNCSSYLDLDPSMPALFFDREYNCAATQGGLADLGLPTAPFAACLVLCAMAVPLHLLALLYPALVCRPCAQGSSSSSGSSPCRPAPGPEVRCSQLAVLGLKLAPAILVLAGALAALGLPPGAILKALGSPRPGAMDAAGVVLAKVAAGLSWGAVALEVLFSIAWLAHASRAALQPWRPLPPPAAPPQPTPLEARALLQAQAMVDAGLLQQLQPQPVLPEDLRAYGVRELGVAGGEGGGAWDGGLGVDLYHCRQRLLAGAPLKEDGVVGGAEAAEEGAVVPLALALSPSCTTHTRLKVRLGEEGSEFMQPSLQQQLQQQPAPPMLALLMQQALYSGGEGRGVAPFGLPPDAMGAPKVHMAPDAPCFCSACGASLAAGAHFCAQCGAGVQPKL